MKHWRELLKKQHVRKRVKAKWDSCQTTQNLDQETESVRHWEHQTGQVHVAAAHQSHFPRGVQHCKRTHHFHTEMKEKTQVWDHWGKRQRVGKHSPTGVWSTSCGSHMVIWWCFGREQRVSWEELEEGPVLHLQTCGEDFPRDMTCWKQKCRDIYWKLGQRRGRPTVLRSASCRLTRGDVLGEALGRGCERTGQSGWSHWEKSSGWILCEYCLWEGKLELQENTMRYRHGRMCNVKRGLCWTQAQGSGWSGRKIHRVVNSDSSGLVDFSERSDRTKKSKGSWHFLLFYQLDTKTDYATCNKSVWSESF